MENIGHQGRDVYNDQSGNKKKKLRSNIEFISSVNKEQIQIMPSGFSGNWEYNRSGSINKSIATRLAIETRPHNSNGSRLSPLCGTEEKKIKILSNNQLFTNLPYCKTEISSNEKTVLNP